MILPYRHHHVSRPFLLSIRFRSSSCAALRIVERDHPTDSSLNSIENLKFQSHDGFKKISGVYSPGWSNTNSLSTDIIEKDSRSRNGSNGSIVELDRKRRLKWYSEKLRNCTLNLGLKEGKTIHGQVIRSGIDLDSHLWVSLINFYAKCRSLYFARRVFDEMPERDVVSWTALIGGLVAEGYSIAGVRLFSEMRRQGVKPNEYTLTTVLKACSLWMDLDFGKQLHTEVIKVGVFSDIYVGSALVDLYAKCSEMEYADEVLFSMPEQNVVAWNVLLNGYTQMDDVEEVLGLFCRMTEFEMKFSQFTLSTVLKGCANSGYLRAGQAVHSVVIKVERELDEFISCGLVDMYSKCGLADDALKVFWRIKNPDIVAWSAMISCLDQQERKQEATELFHLMRRKGLRPNQFTLSSLLNAATDLGDPYYCESIHACIYKYGFESENLVGNTLIAMYMKIGSVYHGHQVFDAMGHWDVVSWNALLSGFHDNETCDQGPTVFKHMLLEGFKPNKYTLISILRSCSSLSSIGFGKQVHAHIIKDNLDKDVYVGTALIDMFTKCKCMEEAEMIFNRLSDRDIFTWTVMIAGHAQTYQGEKAIQCFNHMQKAGVKSNEFTLASCLRACSVIASLENGRQLHSLAIKAGHYGDLFVDSALVDMYTKCGCLDDAETYFKGMDSRDTVSWNTIICGYSQHGQGEKALEAFKLMLNEGASPDEATFIGILSVCSHMGLIDEGKRHFYSMSEIYGITPSTDHYACMVDILGRAGKLNEVSSFVEQMEFSPDTLIWQTVLGVCMIHGNVELAEKAADKLFEIEPETDSNYILLSNIFAAKGRWDDVSKVRALMSIRGVKKEVGCSWIVADAQTHVFLSEDASHPKILEIYQVLEELGQKLSSTDYFPNTDSVLHNVTDREKKENLFYHSES